MTPLVLPPGAVTPARTRVLRALLRVWERDGRATVRDVSVEAGLRSMSTAHSHLSALRRAGLVAWEPNHEATLRPLVAVVPQTAPDRWETPATQQKESADG